MAAEEVAVKKSTAQRTVDISQSSGVSVLSPSSARDSLVSPARVRNPGCLGVTRSPAAVCPASLDVISLSPVNKL